MNTEAETLEKKAYNSFLSEEFSQAFNLFTKAAEIYKQNSSHQKSALCFASAASCWSKQAGEKIFCNAAASYESAARQAKDARDFEYASLMYKYAAVNYERDREFYNYSDCFYRSKECYRKFLTYKLFQPRKIYSITPIQDEAGLKGFLKRVLTWSILTISFIIWGHGERPARTFFTGILIISIAAGLYTLGRLLRGGVIFDPNFSEAMYFSVVTFTTLGYGDISPAGWSKLVVIIESFSGIFTMPLFLIGLSRKYLRI